MDFLALLTGIGTPSIQDSLGAFVHLPCIYHTKSSLPTLILGSVEKEILLFTFSNT